MKYVRLDIAVSEDLEKAMIIAFPNDFIHADVAEAMKAVAEKTWGKPVSVTHAGEINATASATHGKSETLGKAASSEDAHYFNNADYGGNYF